MFVLELRSLAEFCNFGDTLEVMLRDRLVCRINNNRMQQRLLSEPKLTFKRALELAQEVETAAKSKLHAPTHMPGGVTLTDPTSGG